MTKQEVDELMKIKGNTKGTNLQTHAVYIRYKQGNEGIKMLEEKLKELGHPLEFDKVKPLSWYPEALSVLIIVTAKDIFNWTDKDIFEMGKSAPKSSFVIDLLIKYLLSPQRCFKEAGRLWRRHLDFGELEAHEFNEKEKYVVIRLKGYKFYPILCVFFAGYFFQITKFVIKSDKVTVEETKCTHRGDPYDEYTLRWE